MASKAFDILDDATSYIDQQERQTGIKFIRRSTSPGFATGGKLLCEPPKFGCVLSVIGYDPEIFPGPFSSICYVPVFLGRSFVNGLCPWIGDSVTYFIHRIAIHDATKLSGMLFNAINARNAINAASHIEGAAHCGNVTLYTGGVVLSSNDHTDHAARDQSS